MFLIARGIGGATQLCAYTDHTIVARNARIGQAKLPVGGGFVTPNLGPARRAQAREGGCVHCGQRNRRRNGGRMGMGQPSGRCRSVDRRNRAPAEQIARIPADVLRIKKLAINRAAEASGPRAVAAGLAEMDALVHGAPSVRALPAWVGEVGVAQAVRAYRAGEEIPDWS